MTRCAKFVAAGFVPYGRVPAPGTFGSIVAMFVWVVVHRAFSLEGLFTDVALCGAVILAGWWAISAVLASLDGGAHDSKDPQWIVIDEWAGMFIALIGAESSALLGLLSAFALFRLFDITKPGPVGWAERLPRATGIMADDIVAGICALGVRLLLEWGSIV